MAKAIPRRPPQWVMDRIDAELSYDPLSGWIEWLVSPQRGTKKRAGDRAGTLCDKGRYRRLTFWRLPNERIYVFEHNLAFYLREGEWPSLSIDHRDRDGTNNKWDNLRLATARQQQIPSGYKAQLCLGYFRTPEEAAAAYQAAVMFCGRCGVRYEDHNPRHLDLRCERQRDAGDSEPRGECVSEVLREPT
jgi:hypothetical protein